MTPTRHRPGDRRHHSVPARVLAALGGVVLFFGVASLIEPSNAPARSSVRPGFGSAGQLEADGTMDDGLLGTLIGAAYTVEIFAGTPEPVYTVYDAVGNRLAERAPKDEIYRIDPSLDLDSMMGPAVGLVDIPDF